MLLRRKANFSKEEACICGILQNNDSSSFSLLRDWKFTRPVGENIFHRKWNSLFRSIEIEHESIKSLWDFFPSQTLMADVTISIAFKRGTDIQVILYWSDGANIRTFCEDLKDTSLLSSTKRTAWKLYFLRPFISTAVSYQQFWRVLFVANYWLCNRWSRRYILKQTKKVRNYSFTC